MKIAHNIAALNAYNRLNKNNKSTGSSMEKLSSGQRINKAADDAAGLAISEKMRGQIRGLEQAHRNIQDGISVVQTADGAFQQITEMIHRQRELIVQGMNGTYSYEDKKNIEQEINQLTEAIDNIAKGTSFNTINLLARDDYQILDDRSSHTEEVTTSGPFPPTVTDFEQGTYFFPIGTSEVPLSVQSSNTGTTVTDSYTTDSRITPITSTDGRQGYNDYERTDHTHTETTATEEHSYERTLVSDPRYKELDVKYNTIENVFFQTTLIPTGTLAGEYPDFGGFEDRFTAVEIDGVPHTLDQFTLIGSSVTSDTISAVYEKDGIQVEKIMSSDGTSFKAEFKIRNLSGVDDKQIKFNTAFQPEYNGNYAISSPSGVPVGNTASNAEIPDSGAVFTLSNDLVDFDFSFLSGGSYTKPDSLTTGSATLLSGNSPGDGITPSWEIADLDDGAVVEFGISLDHFNFKKDVYRVTNQKTTEIDSVVQTVTTDIKDIDYVPPKIDIQTGDQENQFVSVPLYNVKADGLGITNIGILPPSVPENSLVRTDGALARVTNYRSVYGALQNRLEHTMNNVDQYAENLTAAESRIRDADMAKEMLEATKSGILTQTAQAMLAHSNQNPQALLQLFES